MTKKQALETPVLAVDVAVFGMEDGNLNVWLYHRDRPPFQGALCLPGSAVRVDERLQDAAGRAIAEKLGVVDPPGLHLEQLACFDALHRDPRGRTVSMAWLGLLNAPLSPASGTARPVWRSMKDLDLESFPFDHGHILKTALDRLQGKLRYTNIACRLLPPTFRIDELQAIYEGILDMKLNRANFRSKLLKIGMIEQVARQVDEVGEKGGRPAHVYRFREERLIRTDRDFL